MNYILRFTIILSTALSLSLPFFTKLVTAQDNSVCFLTDSSEKLTNLDNLCQSQAQKQALQKTKICESPFDSDGFPLVIIAEAERLKKAIAAKIATDNLDPEGTRVLNIYLYFNHIVNYIVDEQNEDFDEPELKAALQGLVDKIPILTRQQILVQNLNSLERNYWQLQVVNEDSVKQSLRNLGNQLSTSDVVSESSVSDDNLSDEDALVQRTFSSSDVRSIDEIEYDEKGGYYIITDKGNAAKNINNNPEHEIEQLEAQIQSINESIKNIRNEMYSDPCYSRIEQAFNRKFYSESLE